MRFTKFLPVILIITFMNSVKTYCQISHYFSAGPEVSFPGKRLGSNTPASLGGSFQYQLKFNAPLAIQLHAGFNHFTDALGGKVNFTPVRAGLVGYVYKDIFFADICAGISHFKATPSGITKDGFSFGLGGGYRQMFGNSQFVQVSFAYNSHNYKNATYSQDYNYTWFNVRAAYGFSFGGKKEKKDE